MWNESEVNTLAATVIKCMHDWPQKPMGLYRYRKTDISSTFVFYLFFESSGHEACVHHWHWKMAVHIPCQLTHMYIISSNTTSSHKNAVFSTVGISKFSLSEVVIHFLNFIMSFVWIKITFKFAKFSHNKNCCLYWSETWFQRKSWIFGAWSFVVEEPEVELQDTCVKTLHRSAEAV
jgi:hypothetical protein